MGLLYSPTVKGLFILLNLLNWPQALIKCLIKPPLKLSSKAYAKVLQILPLKLVPTIPLAFKFALAFRNTQSHIMKEQNYKVKFHQQKQKSASIINL